jgi:type IV pilus biogenesis protein CpaD/CtpE
MSGGDRGQAVPQATDQHWVEDCTYVERIGVLHGAARQGLTASARDRVSSLIRRLHSAAHNASAAATRHTPGGSGQASGRHGAVC